MAHGLVELLNQVTHRITVKAERRIVDELVDEAREVRGKAVILLRVVEAASRGPEGIVREVIFAVIGEEKRCHHRRQYLQLVLLRIHYRVNTIHGMCGTNWPTGLKRPRRNT